MFRTIATLAGAAAVAAALVGVIPAFSGDSTPALKKADRSDADVRCELRDWPFHKSGCLAYHPKFDEFETPVMFVAEAAEWPAIPAEAAAVVSNVEAPSSWQMSPREVQMLIEAGNAVRVGS